MVVTDVVVKDMVIPDTVFTDVGITDMVINDMVITLVITDMVITNTVIPDTFFTDLGITDAVITDIRGIYRERRRTLPPPRPPSHPTFSDGAAPTATAWAAAVSAIWPPLTAAAALPC